MKAVLFTAALLLAAASARADEPAKKEGAWLIERDTVQIQPENGHEVNALSVDNRLGDITVVGTDGDSVSLTVVRRAPDGETLDRMKVNLITNPDGTIVISTALLAGMEERPLPAASIRIDLTLEVPRGAHVDLKAWNGKLAVTGLRAGASLTAHAGELTVTDVSGPVVTESVRGKQTLAGVRGDVKADSTYGELSLDGVGGDKLAASTHDGAVVATRISSRKVKIRTTFGTIHFSGELFAGGEVELISYKGSIDVRLQPSDQLAFRVDAWARDGEVESRMELTGADRSQQGHLMGTYGPSKKKPAVLKITSMAGDVRFGLAND